MQICVLKVKYIVNLQIYFKIIFLKFVLKSVNEFENGEEIKKLIFLNIDV